MNRLFGTGNKKTQEELLKQSNQSLSNAQSGLESKISTLDTQIQQVTIELQTINKRLKQQKTNSALRSRAMKLLNKRKQLEKMRDQLDSQIWSMSQAQMTSDNLVNTMLTVDALQKTNKVLQKQYGKINIDKIQDMQDEMMDLIEQGNELQNVLASNQYEDPNAVSEGELDAELDALMDEDDTLGIYGTVDGILSDTNVSIPNTTVPSYLSNNVPDFIDEDGGELQKTEEGAKKEAV
ncbi:related to Vacuolar protein-sorting-associated protein 60 [Saccharomycodes ludwigii]|uniref:Related to Vacuolar protein-sorting-associated protein 60 n=1 Tax=Saccharomycodes ludwigii TaxID=36035 RepID=A0A376B735_9ASCO|nr:hypothetical protein SCDLUD_002571 [Saccharomycodes ludwigii]KAH3901095.1 hypothetical protein SCDLUD_002571 [Saccharomycodes ludwigii]SSD60517.1 related to Vacuolar protein-sorting-associated protein 60 [Saccharomycodes ludwigii]